MFSTNPREVAPATRPLSRGGTGAGGGSVDYAEDTTAARIDAAINAAMAVDATRGANTFNQPYFTPQGSTTSMTGDGGENGGMSFSPAPAPPQGGGGGVAVIPPMPSVPVVGGSRGSGSTSGGHTRSGYSGHASGGSGGGAYKSYHPSSGSHPSVGSMPGLVGMSNSTGYGSTGHAPRAVAPVEESVASPSLGQRSGSSGAGSFGGGAGSGRGNGHGNGVASTDPFSFSKPNNSGGGGGGFGHIGGHVRAIGSGGSGGGAQQQQPPTTRSVWERGGAAPTPKAVWQPEPPAPVTVVPGVGGDDLSSEGSSGRGGAAEQGGGQQYQRHQQYRDDDEDDGGGDHDHYKTDSSGALPPPDQRVSKQAGYPSWCAAVSSRVCAVGTADGGVQGERGATAACSNTKGQARLENLVGGYLVGGGRFGGLALAGDSSRSFLDQLESLSLVFGWPQ